MAEFDRRVLALLHRLGRFRIRPGVGAGVVLVLVAVTGCVGADDDAIDDHAIDDNADNSASGFVVDRQAVDIADTVAVVYNSPDAVAIGRSRLVVKAVTQAGAEYGGPDVDTVLVLEGPDETLEVATRWVWSSEGYSGFYIANATMESPGSWTATLASDDGRSFPFSLEVSTISIVPAVGQSALASDSKVLGAGVELDAVTTDEDPDPGFYSMTVAEAVRSGRPSVIVFATPLLCRTAVCGPVLDEMKSIAPGYDGVNFVHVEIYEPVDLDEVELIPVPAVVEWQLPSEPWVFVVDGDGLVAASFEGFTLAEEVATVLDDL